MSSRTPTFAELVGDEPEFFATYYGVQPLFRPGALSGDVTEILSIADMDDIVHQEGLRPSLFRMLGQGVGVGGPALTKRLNLRREGKVFEDALAADKVYAHFRAGKTLIHGGLNHTRPNLRRMCAMLTEKFAGPSEAVAFLSPAGTQGSTPHSDPTDVYVIHLEGAKRWRVWSTPEQRRAGTDLEFTPAELGEPILDVVLRPGDVLYLPYGTPHAAVAEQGVSLHLTVLAITPTWTQLLAPVVLASLAEHPEFWPAPYLGAPTSDLVQAMKAKVAVLMEHLSQVDPAVALHQEVEQGQAYEGVVHGSFFQDTAAIDGIDQDTMVVAVAGSTTFAADANAVGQSATVTVLGNTLRMPAEVATALAAAQGALPCRAGDFLPEGAAERGLASVKQLIRLGALRVSASQSVGV